MDEEDETIDDAFSHKMILQRQRTRGRRNAAPPTTLYKYSRSLQLMMAFEIQRGLEEVETEEQELEERGLEVEKHLRDPGPGLSCCFIFISNFSFQM